MMHFYIRVHLYGADCLNSDHFEAFLLGLSKYTPPLLHDRIQLGIVFISISLFGTLFATMNGITFSYRK